MQQNAFNSSPPKLSKTKTKAIVAKADVQIEKSAGLTKKWRKRTFVLYSDATLDIVDKKSTKTVSLRQKTAAGELDVSQDTALILKLTTGILGKYFRFKVADVYEIAMWKRAFRCLNITIKRSTSTVSVANTGSFLGSLMQDTQMSETETIEDNFAPYSGFDKKEVELWTTEDVQNWLSFVYVDFGVTLISNGVGYILRQNQIDGKKLLSLTLLDFQHIGIQDSFVLEVLTEELAKVAQSKRFSFSLYKMQNKFASNRFIRDASQLTFQALKKKNFFTLHDPVELQSKLMPIEKEKYLVEGDNDEAGEDDSEERRASTTISTPYAQPSSLPTLSSSMIEMPSNGTTISKVEEATSVSDIPKKNRRYRLKVKLILTELPDVNPTLLRLFSPSLSILPKDVTGSYWGLFHSALVIGPWYVDWVNQEWVYPRGAGNNGMSSKSCIFAGDIGYIELNSDADFKEFYNLICGEIATWNVEYTYRNAGTGKKEKKGNCQDFVKMLLESIGKFYKPVQHPKVENFLQTMRNYGHNKATLAVDSAFQKEFGLEKDSYSFATHEELDKFVEKVFAVCQQNGKEFETAFPGEYLLLKAFDRSFWLRHAKHPSDIKFRPATSGGAFPQLACPFDDPIHSLSLDRR